MGSLTLRKEGDYDACNRLRLLPEEIVPQRGEPLDLSSRNARNERIVTGTCRKWIPSAPDK